MPQILYEFRIFFSKCLELSTIGAHFNSASDKVPLIPNRGLVTETRRCSPWLDPPACMAVSHHHSTPRRAQSPSTNRRQKATAAKTKLKMVISNAHVNIKEVRYLKAETSACMPSPINFLRIYFLPEIVKEMKRFSEGQRTWRS